jgi:hypothetical protein
MTAALRNLLGIPLGVFFGGMIAHGIGLQGGGTPLAVGVGSVFGVLFGVAWFRAEGPR